MPKRHNVWCIDVMYRDKTSQGLVYRLCAILLSSTISATATGDRNITTTLLRVDKKLSYCRDTHPSTTSRTSTTRHKASQLLTTRDTGHSLQRPSITTASTISPVYAATCIQGSLLDLDYRSRTSTSTIVSDARRSSPSLAPTTASTRSAAH